MRHSTRFDRARTGRPPSAYAAAAFLALALAGGLAQGQPRTDRSGREVVDQVCVSCHGPGTNNAPRIGDQAAWQKRAAQGLSALTEHAIKGIREMPAHGGNAGVNDLEIERAITYMVNASGGHWVEPIGAVTPAAARSYDQIVQTQCAKCHQDGKDGAPRIGDRAAWIPRLKKGLDALVASAVHGHGGMPPRGGEADLSDGQIRGAIVAMFNAGLPPTPVPPAAAAPEPFHRTVGGAEVYLGVISVDALRSAQAEGHDVGTMSEGIPSGKGWYHINISLADIAEKAPITDADVSVKVADPMRADTRKLHLMAANRTVSYGGFFRMDPGKTYTVTAIIQRRGASKPIEARFEYRPR